MTSHMNITWPSHDQSPDCITETVSQASTNSKNCQVEDPFCTAHHPYPNTVTHPHTGTAPGLHCWSGPPPHRSASQSGTQCLHHKKEIVSQTGGELTASYILTQYNKELNQRTSNLMCFYQLLGPTGVTHVHCLPLQEQKQQRTRACTYVQCSCQNFEIRGCRGWSPKH